MKEGKGEREREIKVEWEGGLFLQKKKSVKTVPGTSEGAKETIITRTIKILLNVFSFGGGEGRREWECICFWIILLPLGGGIFCLSVDRRPATAFFLKKEVFYEKFEHDTHFIICHNNVYL